jgi:hypothetical protein
MHEAAQAEGQWTKGKGQRAKGGVRTSTDHVGLELEIYRTLLKIHTFATTRL